MRPPQPHPRRRGRRRRAADPPDGRRRSTRSSRPATLPTPPRPTCRIRAPSARWSLAPRTKDANNRFGNPYFGTGCSTSLTGEPDTDVTNLERVKASLFRKKAFTIRLAGSTAEGGIAYRSSTVLKFMRVRR